MPDDPLSGCDQTAEEHGWRFGWNDHYPRIIIIACPCGHVSVREREEVEDHVCPTCGRGEKKCP